MPRKNYTPEERALHLIGALAGKSLKEINDAVAYSDAAKMVPVQRMKEIPQGSLDMLKKRYGHLLVEWREDQQTLWHDLWEHCNHPKKVGDL
jgi:hypothetical protein